MTLAHWDDLEPRRPARPALGGAWTNLGAAAGSVDVGVHRIQLDEGEVSTPAHVHGADEEIFFVLAGSGLSWQDGETHEIRAGDCIVHVAQGKAHTLRAGGDGLDVLAFGERVPLGGAHLPNVGIRWLKPSWTESGTGENPFDRDQHIDWPDPSPRPDSIINLDDVEAQLEGRSKRVAIKAGAVRTGLNWLSLRGGEEGAPPHCHSAEEEIFVVLDGEGELLLWAPPSPESPLQAEPTERHALRRGSVVSRPAGTRISHSFVAGDAGLTLLAYGERDTSDVCWYPRSNKIFFRGLGVIGRLELLSYFDGEPA